MHVIQTKEVCTISCFYCLNKSLEKISKYDAPSNHPAIQRKRGTTMRAKHGKQRKQTNHATSKKTSSNQPANQPSWQPANQQTNQPATCQQNSQPTSCETRARRRSEDGCRPERENYCSHVPPSAAACTLTLGGGYFCCMR